MNMTGDNFKGGLGHSAVLRTLPLTESLNSGYAVRYRSSKPFATLRASHTRKRYLKFGTVETNIKSVTNN